MATENVIKIDHAALKKMARQIEGSKGKVDDARIAHANLYAEAERQGFHRQALKLSLKLKNMDAAKLNDFWAALTTYNEVLGIFAQGDLLDSEKPGDAAVA